MLKARALTAVALLIPFFALLYFAPNALWAWLMVLVVLGGLNEWARLTGIAGRAQAGYLFGSGFIAAFLLGMHLGGNPGLDYAIILALLALSAVFWVVLAPLWLRRGWALPRPWLAALTGWLILFPAWTALVVLREEGPGLLLALMGVVWVSDTAAYFAGRRFGRHKLAPSVSPGKTWEGAAGAAAAVALYMLALHLLLGINALYVPLSLVLVALGILGDLFESWIKRRAGVKDSGDLLPGHGGLLDRIDALLPVLPVAALFLIFTQMQ